MFCRTTRYSGYEGSGHLSASGLKVTWMNKEESKEIMKHYFSKASSGLQGHKKSIDRKN